MTGADLFEILMTNDRFRFRAWDSKENKYIYDAQHQYDNEVECFGYMLDDTYKGRYMVEQCTGLKDNNGKLIYEGDIVKNKGRNYKVIFTYEEVASCGCCVDSFSGCGFVLDNGYSRGDLDKYSEMEVVGNVHENVELLK